jgi:hypothetical protein
VITSSTTVYFKNFPENVPDTVEFWLELLGAALVEHKGAVAPAPLWLGGINLLALPGYGTYRAREIARRRCGNTGIVGRMTDVSSVLIPVVGTVTGAFIGAWLGPSMIERLRDRHTREREEAAEETLRAREVAAERMASAADARAQRIEEVTRVLECWVAIQECVIALHDYSQDIELGRRVGVEDFDRRMGSLVRTMQVKLRFLGQIGLWTTARPWEIPVEAARILRAGIITGDFDMAAFEQQVEAFYTFHREKLEMFRKILEERHHVEIMATRATIGPMTPEVAQGMAELTRELNAQYNAERRVALARKDAERGASWISGAADISA